MIVLGWISSETAPSARGPGQPGPDAGLTLVEVMVSLALFALIAVAGFSFVDSELRVRAETEGRLERLGNLQRAMYVLTSDLEQMSDDPILSGEGLAFRRYGQRGGEMDVRYALAGGTLQRILGVTGDRTQQLASGVSAVRWRFYMKDRGWQDALPPADTGVSARPEAISVDLTVKGDGDRDAGVIRRLVAVPAKP